MNNGGRNSLRVGSRPTFCYDDSAQHPAPTILSAAIDRTNLLTKRQFLVRLALIWGTGITLGMLPYWLFR